MSATPDGLTIIRTAEAGDCVLASEHNYRLSEWQAKKVRIFDLIAEAQAALVNLPTGGVGAEGASQASIESAEKAGGVIGDDSCLHQGQKAWLILERANMILVPPERSEGEG